MIGLDTNVILRLLVDDDRIQAAAVAGLLERSGNGPDTYYLNRIVLAEFAWVLKSRYKKSRSDIIQAIMALLGTSAVHVEDRDIVIAALSLYDGSKADFSDCLIVAGNRAAGCDHTVTFDRAALTLAGMQSV